MGLPFWFCCMGKCWEKCDMNKCNMFLLKIHTLHNGNFFWRGGGNYLGWGRYWIPCFSSTSCVQGLQNLKMEQIILYFQTQECSDYIMLVLWAQLPHESVVSLLCRALAAEGSAGRFWWKQQGPSKVLEIVVIPGWRMFGHPSLSCCGARSRLQYTFLFFSIALRYQGCERNNTLNDGGGGEIICESPFETGILEKHQSIQMPLETYKSVGSQELKHSFFFFSTSS